MGVGKGYKGPAIERFWRKVEFDPATGCLIWVGAVCSSGYGSFYTDEGRVRNAHRWLWDRFEGAVPDGHELDHLCRNRACVNLLHLEAVTPSVNQLRGIGPELSRARAASRTHCPQNHALSGANLYVDATGTRYCRTCRAATARRLRARRKVAA